MTSLVSPCLAIALLLWAVPGFASPWFDAAQAGDDATLSALLKTGADPNQQNSDFKNALHIAIENKHTSTFELLLKAGANPNGGPHQPLSPLQDAVAKNSEIQVSELLHAGADINYVNPTGLSALHFATQYCDDNASILGSLISAGAKIEAQDLLGETPLHLASLHACEIQIQTLLKAGADVNARTLAGNTPLHELYSKDYWVSPSVIADFKNASADFRAKNNLGQTPLHLAASKLQEPDTTLELLASGASVSDEDLAGKTPIFYTRGQWVTLKLIQAGADPSHRDQDGQTPLQRVAVRYGEPNSTDIIQVLLDAHAAINAQDPQGRTVLHLLAVTHPVSFGNTEFLIDSGAEVNALDHLGNTPLDLAQKSGNGLAAYLVKRGAHCHLSCR